MSITGSRVLLLLAPVLPDKALFLLHLLVQVLRKRPQRLLGSEAIHVEAADPVVLPATPHSLSLSARPHFSLLPRAVRKKEQSQKVNTNLGCTSKKVETHCTRAVST